MSDFKYVTGWSMFRSTLPKNAKEVENELIRHASDARPLPAGHAWRVVEVRSNTGLHTSYVGRSSKSNPPAVEGVAVWCCSSAKAAHRAHPHPAVCALNPLCEV